MTIFLQKNILSNPNITDEGIGVYIALRSLMRNDQTKYYISINQLIYILYGEDVFKNNIRYIIDNIQFGINNLVEIGMIKVIHKISDFEYIFDLSQFNFIGNSDNPFVIIESNEIEKIMQNDSRRFKLLKYFVFLIGTISNLAFTYVNYTGDSKNSFVGSMTIDYLHKLTNISPKSILNYNKILEENKLIYIHRQDDYVLTENGIKTLNNCYGRYADKDYIIKYAKENASANGSYKSPNKVSKRKSDEKKSLLMQYNAFVGGKEYPADKLKLIYDFMVEYNTSLDRKGDTISLSKKKDLSVFNKYDFYNTC